MQTISTTPTAAIAAPALPAVTIPAEPGILTANTYFWSAGATASSRRYSEAKHRRAVADYLEALGFTVATSGTSGEVVGRGHGLRVVFSYSESCKNVYKSLSVSREVKGEWKNSNITQLRKVATKLAAGA